MIMEAVILNVRPGEEHEFEDAFGEAKAIIAAARGFESLRLLRCHETKARYLLLVEWATLEDHTVGFRGSAAFDAWRAMLHHFYEPMPTVEHFEPYVGIVAD